MEQLFVFRAKRAGRTDHEISADQTPRLIVDRSRQAVAKRADADERRDPERDRDRKEQQPSPARPAIPPSHFPNEGRAHEPTKRVVSSDLGSACALACWLRRPAATNFSP